MNGIDIEKKLLWLMDFQLFEDNPELESIIESTKARYLTEEKELSDEDLDLNAAGDPLSFFKKEDREHG